MKHSNVRIIGIPEGVEKNRGQEEIFEQIVAENWPNIAREANIRVQEAERTPPKLNHDKPTSRHVIVQFANIRSKDIVLKAARAKKSLTDQGKGIRITSDLSTQTWNERKVLGGAFLKLFERKHAAKDPLSSKAVIQNWWRYKDLPGSAETDQIHNHETSPTGDIKVGSIKVKAPRVIQNRK